MNLYERLYHEWQKGQMITRLIMVNVFVFLVVNILIAVTGLFDSSLYDFFLDALALPTDLSKLIYRPWTIITHGFLHFGLFHMLFNMLWMYWIGKTLQAYIGSKKILALYIYCIIAGAFLIVLAYNFFPLFSGKTGIGYGASAAVLGIIWATVALLPSHRINLPFIGSVPLTYIAAGYTFLDVIGLSSGNAGGSFAHIGGAIMGYWFIKLYQRGTDLSVGFNNAIEGFLGLFQTRQKPKMKVKRGGKSKPQPAKNVKLRNTKKSTTSRESTLNSILDKINEKGYSSLSEKEKAFLKDQSKT